ncbi:MAG: hypothetical protein Q7S08_02485 [bacterium]|nr:hypothetical protein [bacterium]
MAYDKKDGGKVEVVIHGQNLTKEERANFNQPVDRVRFLKALRGEDPDYVLLMSGSDPNQNVVFGHRKKPN